MENTIFLERLLNELNKIIPSKNLVNELAELLTIEKASVYRRLKGKIPFSFFEAALLARKTGISLDKIINRYPISSLAFVLPSINYITPSAEDYEVLNEHFELILLMKKLGKAELTEACNLLPLSLYAKYEHILRFYTFKWFYQYEIKKGPFTYKDVSIDEKFKKIQLQHYNLYKETMQRSHYIFDYLLFYYIVNDLKYFYFLRLISPEEMALIKGELISLLNEMETTAITGKDPETNNEILIYISNINLETNYQCLSADGFQLVTLKLFLLCAAGSLEPDAFNQIKTWLESLKRHSTLISGCNEVKCRQYFEKQRFLLDKL